jgi:spermidine synthase
VNPPPEARLAVSEKLLLLAYPLFFASGAAGLIYEIVWTRQLIYVFGSGLYAVTAVLSAFMAGLALGSFLLGRVADRLRFPLRFYAILEGLLAIVGLLLPFALRQIDHVDGWAYALWGQNFAQLTACRFVVAFALLLIPTTLMGATLPVLARALVERDSHLGGRVGGLYAINTAGAVVGAFLAGFYLLGTYGVVRTNSVAVALNAIAALGAYFVLSVPIEGRARGAERSILEESPGESFLPADAQTPAPSAIQIPDSAASLVLLGALATGVVSMAAQVIWSRGLVFAFEYLKNTTYAFSAMLTVFLAGLAAGSFLSGLLIDRTSKPVRLYGLVVTLIGISIACSVAVLHWGAGESFLPVPFHPATQEFRWTTAAGNILAQSVFVLGVPTLLMGMAFPIAARAVVALHRVGRGVGRLYALNTAGSLIGPLLACFLIIPWVGLTTGLLILAAAEAALGLWIFHRASDSRTSVAGLALLCAVLFGAVLMIPREGGMQQVNPGERVVYYDEGPMATVSVVKNNFGYNTIYIDGVGVAGTDPLLQTDQKSLAHLPLLLVPEPRAVLTVGFGSGGASYSYLLHDRLQRVDCAEICPEVLKAAPELTDANHGFLARADPRYRVVFDDVRSYLRHTNQTYDVIATDCTDLRYKSNANLYDAEYFRFSRARLNPGGVVVVWMPLGGLSLEMFQLALRTFHLVFPEMAVFFMDNEPTHYILLVGWRDKMEIDFRRMQERLAEADVKADLAELSLDDPLKILSTWITGGEPLRKYLAGDTYNTENFPYLEFGSPKYGYADRPILDNLASLMAIRNSARQFIPAGQLTAEQSAALERYERALPAIITGHAHYRNLEIEDAARSYLKALSINPEDRSVQRLLSFRELALGARIGSPWSWLMLGRAMQLQNRGQEAALCYQRVEEILGPRGAKASPREAAWLASERRWASELAEKQKTDSSR